MARGDGKATKGKTKGKAPGVKRMVLGGMTSSGPSGGNKSPSASMGGFGGQASRAEAGGNSDRVGVGGINNTTSRTERTSAMTSPDAMRARLGPNAAQAMRDAGVNPDVAGDAARSINRRASDSSSILGDRNPGQRLATANRDGSFSYSPVQSSTVAKNQTKQIYDRILPERTFPTAAPSSTLGAFGSTDTSLARVKAEAEKDLAEARRGMPSAEAPFQRGKGSPTAPSRGSPSPSAPFQGGKGSPSAANAPKTRSFPTRPVNPTEVPKLEGTPLDLGPLWDPVTRTFRVEKPKEKATPASSTPPKATGSAGSNFTAGPVPGGGGRGNDDRPRKPKKRPLAEQEGGKRFSNGGAIRKTDGVASRGKTRGRFI